MVGRQSFLLYLWSALICTTFSGARHFVSNIGICRMSLSWHWCNHVVHYPFLGVIGNSPSHGSVIVHTETIYCYNT
ncbi:hypothetical protein F5I97DRAFT_1894331 [Phlebopus sp. FC_14]|nr:hypothetical protein F5I97DRAFT_1894331 [Phlebopus sp. FC_14]